MHENYDGGDVELKGRTIRVADFPHMAKLKGRTPITADGTTLLGGDDKAGVAEIMTMLEQVIKSGIPHGRIAVGFTPDEEIGTGRTVSTLRALAATSPTPWTAARRAASITRTSTPRRPTLPCMALTSIRVRLRTP